MIETAAQYHVWRIVTEWFGLMGYGVTESDNASIFKL